MFVAFTANPDRVDVYVCNDTYLSVEISPFPACVVLDEHHLGTLSEGQHFVGRVGSIGEITLHGGLKRETRSGERFQALPVICLGLVVVGGQPDISAGLGLTPAAEAGNVSLVEYPENFHVGCVFADTVQYGYEILIALPVHGAQFDGGVIGLPEGQASEEIRGLVVLFQHCPFPVLYHRRQLLHIADHKQLNPAERFVPVAVAP